MTKLHVHYSIFTYTQNKINEIWSIAYLNSEYIDHTDSLQNVSDANRPMVNRQSANFVCDLAAFKGQPAAKNYNWPVLFVIDRPTVFGTWQTVLSRATVCRLSADGRLTLRQLLFLNWVIQTLLTVSQSSGDSRPSDGR